MYISSISAHLQAVDLAQLCGARQVPKIIGNGHDLIHN